MELGDKETYVKGMFDTAWSVFIRPRKALEWLNHLARMVDVMMDTENILRRENIENFSALRHINEAITPGSTFYSWQRIWQNATRLRLGLPMDCSMEDIQVALLLDAHKEEA